MTKQRSAPVFKEYTTGQIMLLPRDLEEEIPQNHMVRKVSEAVEKIEMRSIYEQYKGGGTSSYHPKMMLKVLIYAYSEQIYSSRKIAKALRENIHFMWLSGNNQPDFHTINRFRGEILKETINSVFGSVVRMLVDGGYVKLENYFVDGTKIEANANKYSFVWAKSMKKYKENLEEKVKGLLEKIDRINEAEDAEYGNNDLPELGENAHIDSELMERTIKELNEKLKKIMEEKPAIEEKPGKAKKENNNEDENQPRLFIKEIAKTIRELSQDHLPRLKRYEEQEALLNGRNSYSKTDPDATFMRMKDDPMKNGQLKAGYNVQIGTEDRFVVGYSVHQRPADPGCLIPHMQETQRQRSGLQPKNVIADSAYGSEENYVYLEKEQIKAYVKYGTFHKEEKARPILNPFAIERMPYDDIDDTFTCPNGNKLSYKETRRHLTVNGFENEFRIYKGKGCSRCPMKSKCTQAKGNREAQVNLQLWRLKARARNLLLSDFGVALRKQRSVDVETVFGRIKHNWGLRRFHLRGLQKVKVEWGIISIAHNLSNIAKLAGS